MKINFVGRKKIWFAFSGVLIVAGLVILVIKGLSFGIEFKGGTSLDVKFEKPVAVGEVRKVLSKYGLKNAVIQPAGRSEMLIRTVRLSKSKETDIRKALDEKLGVAEVRYVQTVGPGWGKHITRRAIYALLVSLLAILGYISFRFEFKMAVCAVVALFHDILITVGVYALVGREVTPYTVAALLTILGYSLYDTIVVFHRIRENSAHLIKETYGGMVNKSVNQVLIRSINTSVTTLLPVVCVLLIGGETLKDFAFALFVGIASGTYSSIFTASPLLAVWKEREPRFKALKDKYGKIRV